MSTASSFETPVPNLTSGRLLARNTLWSLAGQFLPMGVAVVAVPALVRGLGVDRFGLLSLAWIVIGYLSLFDFGIGRALTQLVAEKLGRDEEDLIPPLAWTSLLLMLVLGILGGAVTAVVSPWLIHKIFKVPAALQLEALTSFYLVSAAVPMITVTAGFRGILEAQQRFRILNLMRIPMSIFSFAGPLAALPFSHSLTTIIAILAGGRFLGLLAHAFACLYLMPSLRRNFLLKASLIAPVLKFGGWMTVSNVISPMMVYMDRFLIGSLLFLPQVTYYAAPFDVVTRLSAIPAALSSVLFPAFTVSLVREPERAGLLVRRGVKYLYLALFPLVLMATAFAPEILRLWLGPGFAENSSSVLRWLAAGVFVNAFAYLPFALIQSVGRPDITAKLHLIELPLYVMVLFLLVKADGITGAAMAWTSRVTIEAIVIFYIVSLILPQKPGFLLKVAGGTVAALALLCGASLSKGLRWEIASGVAGLVMLAFVVFWVVTPEERAFLRGSPGRSPTSPPGIALAKSKSDLE